MSTNLDTNTINNYSNQFGSEAEILSTADLSEFTTPDGKVLNLAGRTSLIRLSCPPEGLQTLIARGCSRLERLPALPLGLKYLNAADCACLKWLRVPDGLKTLILTGCNGIQILPWLPDSIQHLALPDLYSIDELFRYLKMPEDLKFLFLSPADTDGGSNVTSDSPGWNGSTDNPQTELNWRNRLDLSGNLFLIQFDEDFDKHLQVLNLGSCPLLKSLPALPDGLETLNLRDCSSLTCLPELPASLKYLNIGYCTGLKQLPVLPDGLKTLILRGCTGLTSIPALPETLEYLDIQDWIGATDISAMVTLPAALKLRFPPALRSLILGSAR